jgi:hypothetical protein
MISTEHTIGGALISVRIRPISEDTPPNPQVAPTIESFLSMMQKASFCWRDEIFSRCLVSFLEEMDSYLDDRRIQGESMDTETVEEMEDFMDEHLDPKVRQHLKKLGGE